MTARMLAQRQPPFEDRVTAHWPRDPAPKMIGTEAGSRSRGITIVIGRRAPHVRRSHAVRHGGARAGDHAGMSNEKAGANPAHRKSEVSRARFVLPGSGGA